jgi:hypothetical protein
MENSKNLETSKVVKVAAVQISPFCICVRFRSKGSKPSLS